MANEKTSFDSLRFYLTGAGAEGERQINTSGSLGGYRSCEQLHSLSPAISDALAPLRVDWVSPDNGVGTAYITGTGSDTVKYQAPGSASAGTAVSIANGQTKLLQDTDISKFVRVTRTSTGPLTSDTLMTLKLGEVFNNAVAGLNVDSTDRAAGQDQYWALMMPVYGSVGINISVTPHNVTGTSSRPISIPLTTTSSGTVTTSANFLDWQPFGYAEIHKSTTAFLGFDHLECVYFTSRTSIALIIPAGGRNVLNKWGNHPPLNSTESAASSGSTVGVVVSPHPGIETQIVNSTNPGAIGRIDTIANIATSPSSGVSSTSWIPDMYHSGGLGQAVGKWRNVSYEGQTFGVWIHREIPSVAIVNPDFEASLSVEYLSSAASTQVAIYNGHYRVADDSVDNYELYITTTGQPDFASTADAVSASLPFTYAVTATTAQQDFRYTVRKRNKYNLLSQNTYARQLLLSTAGANDVPDLSPPQSPSITNDVNGKIRFQASYYPDLIPGEEDNPADTWAIYIAHGDSTDRYGQTPTTLAMGGKEALGERWKLNATVGPFAYGAELTASIRVRRSSDSAEDAGTAVGTIGVNTRTPGKPVDRLAHLAELAVQQLAAPDESQTVTIGTTSNSTGIRFEFSPGIVDFHGGTGTTNIIWRWRMDTCTTGDGRNGLWTVYDIYDASTADAAASTSAVDITSWNSTDKTLYVGVDSTQAMRIDVTNKIIHLVDVHAGSTVTDVASTSSVPNNTGLTISRANAHVDWKPFNTMFNAWDRGTWEYDTVGSIYTGDKVLRMRDDIYSVASTGDFA